jgi:TetR/AcrR family transcriptional regulator
MFFMMFVEKNKGFARLFQEKLFQTDEQNVSDSVNQFYERFELMLRQMLKEDDSNLITQPGISAQLIITSTRR